MDNFQQAFSNLRLVPCGRLNPKRIPNNPQYCAISPWVWAEPVIIGRYYSHGYVELYVKKDFSDVIKFPNKFILRQGDYSGGPYLIIIVF